jgi:MraZ protein
MLLTGTFVRAIDDKLRLAIPKRFRDALTGSQQQSLFVTPGTDRSLAVYTEETLGRLADRLAAASPAGAEVRAFSRLFYAQAQQVEIDSQGRIRLPAELAALAGLGQEAILLGVQDHLEIWDRGRWEQYLNERQARYDQLAEAAFSPREAGK